MEKYFKCHLNGLKNQGYYNPHDETDRFVYSTMKCIFAKWRFFQNYILVLNTTVNYYSIKTERKKERIAFNNKLKFLTHHLKGIKLLLA